MGKHNLIKIALATSISGLLFGYDTGIISGALLFIGQDFFLSSTDIGIMVSAVPVGALFACIFSGGLSDLFGRKKLLFLTAFLFLAGTLMCTFASSIGDLVLGRIILGVAIGFGSCISPIYVSELAPEKDRGSLVNLFVVAIQAGIFLSFVASYLLSYSGSWRYMIGIGIIPALILAVCTVTLPESPRWLIIKKKFKQATLVLEGIYGKKNAALQAEKIAEVVEKERVDLSVLLQYKFLKVVGVGVIVSFFTQTIGINAINYYAPTIFQTTGFSSATQATFATMFIGLVLTLSTIASLFFIDKVGRRKPLLLGMLGILFSLLVIIVSFAFVEDPMTLGWMMFIASILFMIFHGLSIGPACFLIPSEIFPTKIRGVGMGISVASNWGANVLVAFLFPIGLEQYGMVSVFSVFFAVSVIGWFLYYLYVPETKGVSLEQIELNCLSNCKARELGKVT